MHRVVRWENLKEINHVEDLGLNKNIILKWIMKCHGRYGLVHLCVLKTEINLRVPQRVANFLPSYETLNFSSRVPLHGVNFCNKVNDWT
jgi:hypothetical protein